MFPYGSEKAPWKRNLRQRGWSTVQWVSTSTALAEAQVPFLAPTWLLQLPITLVLQGIDSLFWYPWTQGSHRVHIHAQASETLM